jgi:hypothetical protein
MADYGTKTVVAGQPMHALTPPPSFEGQRRFILPTGGRIIKGRAIGGSRAARPDSSGARYGNDLALRFS